MDGISKGKINTIRCAGFDDEQNTAVVFQNFCEGEIMAQYTLKKAFKFLKFKDFANIFICLFVMPFALIAKIFIRDFWLVCEEEKEARDNGYWFYKWVRENHPKQKIAYAINKKSIDYNKVADLGKVIQYGSLSHWFWYIVADKNISSQKGGKPNAAVCYLFEVVFKMRKNNRVFLQHGVTVNKGEWLFYKNTNVRLFITATQQEYEFIREHFGYPEDNVKLLGFSRFDQLQDIEIDKDMILVMPTWRNWLARESNDNNGLEFDKTEYFNKWNEIMNSKELDELLKKYDKHILFYPHRNMQKFLSYFSTDSERIKIADWKEYDIQDVLKKAALMITDYSSVFFDFAYMLKPVIFYQFDEDEFRAKQYSEGYLDYHNTSLGKWTDSLDGVLKYLENSLKESIPRVKEEDIKEDFPMRDNNNSKRIYDAIKSI